jgi:DNA-binding response OmpR family regulator
VSETLHILIIEDNPADADLISELLPQSGPVVFRAEHVTRLAAAFERLENRDIDLVLLDLGLPDSQGIATFQRLRQAVPLVPVIVLTGSNDEDLGVAAARDGAQDYFVKGQLSGVLLSRAIRYAIERQKALIQIQQHLDELRQWQTVMLGREERHMELKREVNELLARLGEPIRYPSQLEEP